MNLKRTITIRNVIMLVIIPLLIITSGADANGRKKRKYNPKATKAQAIEVIRTNSSEISELAGIEPAVEGSVQFSPQDEGEDLSIDYSVGDSGEDIAELESEDDVTIDVEDFKTLWLQFVAGNDETTSYGLKKTELMDKIMDMLGTPYRFGGTSDRAIDCSGWTQKVFVETANILLPRTAREQVSVGRKITRQNLEFGDLVFFHTYSRRFASHVGIYLGDNLFAHASSRYGVTVSSLESTYYAKRFISGRRLSTNEIQQLSLSKPKTKKN